MTRARMTWFAVWAASLAVAFYLGGRERGDVPAAPTISVRPDAPAPSRCTIDEGMIRRAVSDAVNAKLEGSTPPTTETTASRASATDTQEPEFDPEVAARAYQRGSEILDSAIARGTWTIADAGGLRPVILQLPMEQRHALLDRLFGAVSANQLRNDVGGSPI